jgi:hypothetical protein
VLYFHGAEGNTGQLYVKVDGSKVVYDGDTGDIAKVEWNQWNIDLASLGIDLQNVTRVSGLTAMVPQVHCTWTTLGCMCWFHSQKHREWPPLLLAKQDMGEWLIWQIRISSGLILIDSV